MIAIRYREDPTATIVTAAAIVLLVGSATFMFLAPRPSEAAATKKLRVRIATAANATDAARSRAAKADAFVATNSWTGNVEEISPTALARVTQLARKRGLNLLSFRPQRASTTTLPVQLPYLATVEGTYPAILQLTRDLETKGSRLVVSSIMVSSTDAASDRVTASIGLVAFINPAVTTPAPPKEKPNA
ncbi:MAG: hypothetical protein ACAH95_04360 [Fimbriimonas sp.]